MRVLLLVFAAAAAFAQNATPPLQFEVAAIKLSKDGVNRIPLEFPPGGGFRFHASLDFLLQIIYRIKPFQLVGAPRWLETEHYSIEAKAPEGATSKDPTIAREQTVERIRALLEDRFRMVVRREFREVPAYVLTVAKSGHKLKELEPTENFRLRLGKGRIAHIGGAKIALLVSLLSNNLDKVVIDKTGLTGSYNLNLEWTPDSAAIGPNGAAPPETSGPSLFAALQEQLGLRLDVQKSPVEHIVIERIERPTEN